MSRDLKGLKSREEVFAKVEQQTDPIRFLEDGSGYFFTYSTNGDRINVPINKTSNGKNCLHLKDKKGILFVEEFVKASKNGGGFVTYYFEKEGKGVQPKLSYVKLVPGTDVIVGAGVYIDNIDDDLAKLKASVLAGTQRSNMHLYSLLVIVLALLTTTAWLISRSILKPIGILRSAAQNISKGHFEHRIDYSSRDELGGSAGFLNQAFDRVIDKMYWYESLLDAISYPISVTDTEMN